MEKLSLDHNPVLHGRPRMSTWPNTTQSNIKKLDEAVDFLTVFIQESMLSNTRTLPRQQQKLLPSILQIELTKKRRLRRTWQHS